MKMRIKKFTLKVQFQLQWIHFIVQEPKYEQFVSKCIRIFTFGAKKRRMTHNVWKTIYYFFATLTIHIC